MLLVVIAAVLLVGHGAEGAVGTPPLAGPVQLVAGVMAGFGRGRRLFSGVAGGGELLIPALVVLFECDIKLDGSLSPAVSL